MIVRIFLPRSNEYFIVDEGEEEAIKIQKTILEANTLAWIIYINEANS